MIQKLRPVTDKESEILTILSEECAEVIQAKEKIIRFGWDSTNPYDAALGKVPRTNREMFLGEVADAMALFEVMYEEAIITDDDLFFIEEAIDAKKKKLRKYSNIYE